MVNVDGVAVEKERKFNILERWLLKINHDFAALFADKIIVDSQAMKKYVNRKYGKKQRKYISYGIDSPDRIIWDENHPAMKPYTNPVKINPGKYYLVVARLEPENNIHIIINGFHTVKTPITTFNCQGRDFTSKEYQEEIESSISEASHNPHIIFLGSIYDPKFLNVLRQNCTAYIPADHTVGGTNPST